MLFSGKIPFHVPARLTPRFWVPHLLRFATLRHCSRLFALIRIIRYSLFATIRYSLFGTIREYSHYSGLFAIRDYSLFALRNYSRLFALRVFQTPYCMMVHVSFAIDRAMLTNDAWREINFFLCIAGFAV